MKKTSVVCVAVILLMASLAGASTVWNPAGNDINPPDTGDWSVAENWSNGVPTLARYGNPNDAADETGKAQFFGTKAECQVTTPDAVVWWLVTGDNQPMSDPIRIMNGGTLTINSGRVAHIGYNSDSHIVVEKGGSLIFGNHLWMARNKKNPAEPYTSTIDINGGYVRVDEMLGLNWNSHALNTARINVNSGILSLHNFNDTRSIGGSNPASDAGSGIDIRYGKIVFDGIHSQKLTDELADGRITGFGLVGNVVVEEIDGNTTITGIDPMEASPTYDEEDVYYEDVTLSWKNQDPNNAGAPLVNVWFGQLDEGETEPNKTSPLYNLIVENEPWSEYMSVLVGELDEASGIYFLEVGTYYWQVELVNLPVPDRISTLYSFTTTDDLPPEVDAGLNVVTWIGKETQLNAIIDDGDNTPNISWEANPPDGVLFSSTTISNPKVTIDNANTAITLTVTADDGVNDPVSDTLTIAVYDDACDAARNGVGEAANYPSDFNADCITNFMDLAAEIASKWLDDYALTEPIPQP